MEKIPKIVVDRLHSAARTKIYQKQWPTAVSTKPSAQRCSAQKHTLSGRKELKCLSHLNIDRIKNCQVLELNKGPSTNYP